MLFNWLQITWNHYCKCKNEYTINDTQTFSQELSTLPPLEEDEEDASYDVKSLFNNIPVEEAIDYNGDQFYMQKKLTLIFTNLVFKRLHLRTCYWMQVLKCNLLNIKFVNIGVNFFYMVTLENDTVTPLKPKFYKIYVDDMFNRRKGNTNDNLKRLNNYHPKNKFTIQLDQNKFLDTKLIYDDGI